MRRLTALLVCIAALQTTAAWSQDSARLLVKLGGEVDTNARRVTGEQTTLDGLARMFLKGDFESRSRTLGVLGARLLVGAKTYLETHDEDTIASAISLRYARRLFGGSWGRLALYASGDVRDRSEEASRRDYLRGGGVGGLQLVVPPLALSVGGGYQGFLYKPDAANNHAGGRFESTLRLTIEGWSAVLGYSLLDRAFDVDRFVRIGDLVTVDQGVLRRDILHAMRVGGGWRGDTTVLGVSYRMQINDSNSYGPGLVRHIGQITWSQSLGWDLVLGLRGSVQWTFFDDAVRIDETLQIDDENRNQVQLNLAWAFTETFGLELRYALYTQAFGAEARFLRQLIFLGVRASVETL